MATPRVIVEAPPVTPRPFGLLSAALVLDDLTGPRQMGTQYEAEACGAAHLTRAACEAADEGEFGTLSVSVDAAGLATLDAGGAPTADYTIEWGDGESTGTQVLDGATHTYDDAGTYALVVTDDRFGYRGTASVTVDGVASGPFAAEVAFSKVPTDGSPWVEDHPFTVYSLFRCAPIGVDLEARAAAALRGGEQRAAEEGLAQFLRSAPVVDLSSTGTTYTPAQGLAVLEAYAGAHYGGVPVIHMPPDATTLLAKDGLVQRSGNGARLETLQGSLVASGGGYVGNLGFAVGPGIVWLFVTGQVVVRRAPTVEATPMTMSRTPATNQALVLAERPYSVAWECITAAVQVDLGLGGGDA